MDKRHLQGIQLCLVVEWYGSFVQGGGQTTESTVQSLLADIITDVSCNTASPPDEEDPTGESQHFVTR